MEKIKAGIGYKLSLVTNYVTTFFAGFAVAFAVSWKATLVISVLLPVMSITILICTKVCYCPLTDITLCFLSDISHVCCKGAECICSSWCCGTGSALLNQNCGGIWGRRSGWSQVTGRVAPRVYRRRRHAASIDGKISSVTINARLLQPYTKFLLSWQHVLFSYRPLVAFSTL